MMGWGRAARNLSISESWNRKLPRQRRRKSQDAGQKKRRGEKNESSTESKPGRKGLKGESWAEYKQGKARRSGQMQAFTSLCGKIQTAKGTRASRRDARAQTKGQDNSWRGQGHKCTLRGKRNQVRRNKGGWKEQPDTELKRQESKSAARKGNPLEELWARDRRSKNKASISIAWFWDVFKRKRTEQQGEKHGNRIHEWERC